MKIALWLRDGRWPVKRLIGLVLGLTVALLLTFVCWRKSLECFFLILMRSAFGSMYDLGLTLSYTTPLIFFAAFLWQLVFMQGYSTLELKDR